MSASSIKATIRFYPLSTTAEGDVTSDARSKYLSRNFIFFIEEDDIDGDEVLDESIGDGIARVFAVVDDCDEDDTVSDLWTTC
jgi:hypothetical protein